MMAVLRLRLPRSADFGVLAAAVGRRGGGTLCQLEPLVRADFLSHCVPSIYNSCSIQKGLLNLPKVECLTLVSRYSGALRFSGALGFSAMLRYTVAGQDNALGSSVATLSTNCDAGPVLQFALMVGASATPTPTR